ncbi:MAG: DNA-binding domain-containing protein [Pirellulaceae bacterium]|nr:DNA-binding domain-containing protein [Pirellulaceae bacterium]
MTTPLPLADLQRWLLGAIAHPADGAAMADDIATRLLPSQRQSAGERLAVYQNAYVSRLLGVLRELFPCLRSAVGDDLFEQFALDYLRVHPPTSYTLHALADQFAPFLAATRPADDWAGFLVDLARLEHAFDQVFDGPGPEELEAALEVDVPWRLVPGFTLLAFSHPASSYYTAWKAGENPPWPAASEQFVALLRRDYVVRRFELSRPQFALLADLDAGQSLDDALAALAARSSLPPSALADEVRLWFTRWSAAGFFVAGKPRT